MFNFIITEEGNKIINMSGVKELYMHKLKNLELYSVVAISFEGDSHIIHTNLSQLEAEKRMWEIYNLTNV